MWYLLPCVSLDPYTGNFYLVSFVLQYNKLTFILVQLTFPRRANVGLQDHYILWLCPAFHLLNQSPIFVWKVKLVIDHLCVWQVVQWNLGQTAMGKYKNVTLAQWRLERVSTWNIGTFLHLDVAVCQRRVCWILSQWKLQDMFDKCSLLFRNISLWKFLVKMYKLGKDNWVPCVWIGMCSLICQV